MRRRRERGTLAALLPILVLVGLAQGVEAKHDGEKYHRRSRTRGPMERQIGVDVGLLGSDVLSIDLLGSVTSTSQSPSLSSASAAAQTSSVAAAAAVVSSVSSDSAVSSTTSSTTSTSSVSISSSVAELSHSASSAFTGEPSSSASPSANLFSLNAVSPSATSILESVSASVMASSSAISVSDSSYSSPILTTGGYVRPNTPGELYIQASSLLQPFCNCSNLQTSLQSSSFVQTIYSSLSSATALLRQLDRTISLPMAEARAIPQQRTIDRRQVPGQTGVDPGVPPAPSAPAPAPVIPSAPAPAPAAPSVPEPVPAVPSARPPVPSVSDAQPPAPSLQPPAPSLQPPAPSLQPPAPSAAPPTPSAPPPIPSIPPPAGPTSVLVPPAVPSVAVPGVSSDPYRDDNGFSAPPRPTIAPPPVSQDTAWQFGGFPGATSAAPQQPVPSLSQPQQQLTSVVPPPLQQPSSLAPPPLQRTSNAAPAQPSAPFAPPQQPSSVAPPQQLTSVVPPQQPSSVAPPQQPTSLPLPLQVSSAAPPSQPLPSLSPPAQSTSTPSQQQTSLGVPVPPLSSLPDGRGQTGTSALPLASGPVIPSLFPQPSGPIPGLSSGPNGPVSGTSAAGIMTSIVSPGPAQPTSLPVPSIKGGFQPGTSIVNGPVGQTSLVAPITGGPSGIPGDIQTSAGFGAIGTGTSVLGPSLSSAAPGHPIPSLAPVASVSNIGVPSSIPLPPPDGVPTSLPGIVAPSGVPSVIQQPFSISNPQPGPIASATASLGLLTSMVHSSNPVPALPSISTSSTPILPFTGQPFPLVTSLPNSNPQNSKTNALPVGQPSATSTPVLSDQVPDAVQPSNSGISGQTISSGQALVSAVSSSAAAVPSVPGNADVSVNSRPPTTLIGATQSINIVGPGASEAVSSSVVGIPMPAETSSPAQITAQPSFSSVSVDFKPPTTIMPSASAVEPVQSVPAQVAPSSSVSIAQPIISAEPAVEVSSSASVRFEQPSVVVEPSSFSVASTTRVDAQPTFPPVQISESSSVNAPTSGTPEVTFQPPTPSSSRFEPEIPPSPTSSSAQVVEPSSQSHSTVHEPSPSEVVVQPSTPASESSTTSAPNRPSESSSVDPRPSSSEVVNQPSPPAASDVATSSAGRPAESSSLHAQPSISTGSASPSIAGPTISASSAAPSASSSAFVEQASSDVVSSSYSSEAWAAPSSSKSSTKEDIYVPTQTWLIMAPSASSASSVSTITPTTTRLSQTGSSSTTQLPSTAVIPNSVPTLIVPANSAANKQYAGTGSDEDPLKDTTLISLLLAADQYPWTFVVKSADATSQLFNTFPKLVSGALQVPESDVQTYGLQVYQPASWNGDQADLLTQWLAYIPEDKFAELNAYLKAGLVSNSPLFNQTGIQGALAAQINTAFPLAANSDTAPTATSTKDSDGDDTRTRDIIIGVCVGIGGLLWIGLVFWIYKRIKRNNDRAVHKRLSEHMSMFDEREREQRRFSTAPSLAPSDIDDRPSSFYASPLENDPVFRRQQRRSLDGDSGRYDGSFVGSGSGLGDHSPTYHPSVFGQSWFANPQGQQMRQTQPQNPFEDIVTRSYLNTSGSAKGLSGMAQRRSGPGRPVHKAMIGQPTLHASSLEFREQ